LAVEDHHVMEERTLEALGGTLPYCVRVLDAWQRAGPDPYLVSTWNAQPISSALWSMTVPRPQSKGNQEWIELQDRRTVLKTLPAELYDRLALGIVAALCMDERHPTLGGLRRWTPADLGATVSTRAVPLIHDSIASWRGLAEPCTAPVVECRIAEPDEGGSIEGRVERRGGWVEAALGPGWLVEVWGRGLALVEGCFVLAAAMGPAAHDPVQAVAVRWERVAAGGLEPMTGPAVLAAGSKGWRLHWA